jgi:hypothetical protein
VTIESLSQLGLSFFGLTYDIAPQARANLFKQIHEIVFHGNGGYDWNTIYNMPIWLRKYTFNEIRNYYEEQKDAAEGKQSSGGRQTVISADGKVKVPELLQQVKNAKKPPKYG